MSQITSAETGSINSIGGFTFDKILTSKKSDLNPNALYAVNWNSLQNVNDLVSILASIGFVFSPAHAHFDNIKHLLDLQNPIIPAEQEAKDFRNTKI